MRGFLGDTGDLTSPAGFFHAEFFSWVPLLLITVAIIGATGTLAGEEGAGTLEPLLALPVTRTRLLLEKCAGLTLALLLSALAMLPGFLVGLLFVDLDLRVGRMVLAALNMVPLAFLFLTLSLWAAAALPSRGAAAAVSIGAVVVTYFLNMLGATVTALETPRTTLAVLLVRCVPHPGAWLSGLGTARRDAWLRRPVPGACPLGLRTA